MKKIKSIVVPIVISIIIALIILLINNRLWYLGVIILIGGLTYGFMQIFPTPKKIIILFKKLTDKSIIFSILPTIIWAILLFVIFPRFGNLPFSILNLAIVSSASILCFSSVPLFIVPSLYSLINN